MVLYGLSFVPYPSASTPSGPTYTLNSFSVILSVSLSFIAVMVMSSAEASKMNLFSAFLSVITLLAFWLLYSKVTGTSGIAFSKSFKFSALSFTFNSAVTVNSSPGNAESGLCEASTTIQLLMSTESGLLLSPQ